MMSTNNHMTHIEDLVVYGGIDGTRQSINALRTLRDTLTGINKNNVSVKWDGAPAIFAGIDPTDGQFFIAKKSIFNKNPKVYKTNEDIDADTSGDLSVKLKCALKYLPQLGIKNIIQGDLLYTQDDLKEERINNEDYLVFHPNTIAYGVPMGSTSAERIIQSKIGIAWHTTYHGDDFTSIKAEYGVDVSSFNQSDDVWSQDAMIRDIDVIVNIENINSDLSEIGKLFRNIPSSIFNQLKENQEFAKLLEQYHNTLIRDGKTITDIDSHVDGFINWVSDKFQKEIDKRKTENGKDVQRQKLSDFLSFFNENTIDNMKSIFNLQKLIISSKLNIINIFDKVNNIKTFVKTNDGYKATGAEGYVAIDTSNGSAVKIVNRLEFSYNNFSPNVIKGWDTPGRR